MKNVLATLGLIFGTAAVGPMHYDGATAQESTPAGPRAPVIVELFTSEGCSSCPPADEFLAKLEVQQPVKNAEVIALEEHVDYWNNLGWTDPFSSDTYTLRQYVYAGTIGNGNAYTPQMVVDGQEGLVGSQQRQAFAAIERAAGRQRVAVSVGFGKRDDDGAETFHIQVGTPQSVTAGDTPEVWMAITETGLQSDVKRGENAGENLRHAAVVRKMRKLEVSSETPFLSDETVKVDRNWKRENLRLVIFLQEKKSRRILGAGSAQFGR